MVKKDQQIKIKDCDKLNILCLHGYRQNAESFRSKTGSVRKCLKSLANFTYIDAPHLAKPLNEGDESVAEQRSWWFNKDDGSFKGTNQAGPAIGFEKSLKLVEEEWAKGEYQGLIGFSQGASFVSVICGLSERNMTTIKPKFVIISSGFKSGSLVHKNCYEAPFSVPSLHISGETDEIIPKELSIKLEQCFADPVSLHHAGGHFFPGTVNEKSHYVSFIKDQLVKYLEEKELNNGAIIELPTGAEEEQ